MTAAADITGPLDGLCFHTWTDSAGYGRRCSRPVMHDGDHRDGELYWPQGDRYEREVAIHLILGVGAEDPATAAQIAGEVAKTLTKDYFAVVLAEDLPAGYTVTSPGQIVGTCRRCNRPTTLITGRWHHSEAADATFCALVFPGGV